jgi:hypothetical protein
MLTETAVRAAKAADKPTKLFDGGGMYLLINRKARGCGGSSIEFTARKSCWQSVRTPMFR